MPIVRDYLSGIIQQVFTAYFIVWRQ